MKKSATTQYLKLYAEEEARLVLQASLPDRPWQNVVVIPTYHESKHLPSALDSLIACCHHTSKRTLAIVVVNAKENDPDDVLKDSETTLTHLKSLGKTWHKISENPPMHWTQAGAFDLLVLNRATSSFRFPPNQGVGLARKVGCDLALALHSRGLIESDWIFTSDADVIFPEKYFELKAENAGAAICRYEHIPVDENAPSWRSLQLYEISLRYYEMGLHFAKSPYAFQTLGSTIAVRPSFYAQVRGFPKRMAGEDFYILNKLAKLAPLHLHKEANLLIKDRDSARVPFGTGTSVTKIQGKLAQEEPFTLYAPQAFRVLKLWLELANEYLIHGNIERLNEQMRNQAAQLNFTPGSWESLQNELHLISEIQAVLTKSPKANVRKQHFDIWFDALKTLRFIHVCRNLAFPNQDYRKALSEAEFISLSSPADDENLSQTLLELRS